MSLHREIFEQPEAIERHLTMNEDRFSEAAKLLSPAAHVVIAARGTSDNAARYAQYVWGARNGLSVGLATPSLFSLYGSPPRLGDAVVVGVSQSGQSPDIVSVIDEASRQGRPTIALTNDADSPLAQSAATVIPLEAGPELAVAATKTYTTELAAIAAISEAMAGGDIRLGGLTERVASALTLEEQAGAAASELAEVAHAAVLGRGYNLATAFEWALKMQELSYVVAQPFSTADFLHGPVAVVDEGYPVLAVAVDGPASNDVLEALGRTRERGAPGVLITDLPDAETDHVLRLDAGPEWLSPIPAIVVAQMFTYWLTVRSGNEPDSPRGLSKVTRTR